MKKWIIGSPDEKAVSELVEKGGLPEICARTLVSRGITTVEQAESFFGGAGEDEAAPSLSSPFLIKDMEEAAKIILDAIDCDKRICVYGDYDCDGIMSTVALVSYIEHMGGNVTYYINDRTQGYGIAPDAVKTLAAAGTELIITVDNGISAIEEAKLVSELGIELVITDHHQPGKELPAAAAIINPHRADCPSLFKDLCGCGVVFKLIAAMDGGDYGAALEQFSDLAAIATVADVVPLTGENRIIVQYGLKLLENTENEGLRALMDRAGVKKNDGRYMVSSQTAAFLISPRINAAGRFGTASDAVKLFLTEDEDEAAGLALKLDSLNATRKKTEAGILSEIEESIKQNPGALNKSVLVFYGKDWNHGVIGIVAARLSDRFGKPAFIMSDDGSAEGLVRGSARSPEGFSVHKAISRCSELLVKYGGHSGAGGFSLMAGDIDNFDLSLQEFSKSCDIQSASIRADMILSPEELTVQTAKDLNLLEPFGEKSPQPLFVFPKAMILDVIPLSGGAHTKLRLTYGKKGVYGVIFGQRTEAFPHKAGEAIDIAAYIDINGYNGSETAELRIEDFRKSGVSQSKYFAAKAAYEKYKRGEGADPALACRMAPERADFAAVYRALPEFSSCDAVFFACGPENLNYCKFRLILDIFEELGLVGLNRYDDTLRRHKTDEKVNLESSPLYGRILKELKSAELIGG